MLNGIPKFTVFPKLLHLIRANHGKIMPTMEVSMKEMGKFQTSLKRNGMKSGDSDQLNVRVSRNGKKIVGCQERICTKKKAGKQYEELEKKIN